MRVSSIQFSIESGKPDHNFSTVKRLVEKAVQSSQAPDVILLPELWSTGYALRHCAELSSPSGEREANFLGELAVQYHVAFAGGSVLAEENGRFFNRAQVIDSSGQYIAWYDKIHLFGPMGEGAYLAPGGKRLVFTLMGMPCSCLICYDLRFGELWTKLRAEGVQTVFISAEWPMSRQLHWKTLLQARAVEHQIFIVACNRCGSSAHEIFAGQSLIAAPTGEILAQGGSTEEILSASIEQKFLLDTRSSFPVFQDRRPELYL